MPPRASDATRWRSLWWWWWQAPPAVMWASSADVQNTSMPLAPILYQSWILQALMGRLLCPAWSTICTPHSATQNHHFVHHTAHRGRLHHQDKEPPISYTTQHTPWQATPLRPSHPPALPPACSLLCPPMLICSSSTALPTAAALHPPPLAAAVPPVAAALHPPLLAAAALPMAVEKILPQC